MPTVPRTNEDGDGKNEDQPMKIQMMTGEGTAIDLHVFPASSATWTLIPLWQRLLRKKKNMK